MLINGIDDSIFNLIVFTTLSLLIACGIIFRGLISKLFYIVLGNTISVEFAEKSQSFADNHKFLIIELMISACLEIFILLTPIKDKYPIIEVINSIFFTIIVTWLVSKICNYCLDDYLLKKAARNGRKANSELFISAKVVSNLSIIVIAVIIFAQTHNINIFGLFASLGIGGLAIAFAAQKTLEQFLGGVVIYLDQPFAIDDYIGLPDGTFGRVESIGWRSTKIRTSGKGTVMIIPNNALTQMNIENFSGAKKVMSILNLNFAREVDAKEQALICQVILASTSDIFGLDSRSTDITFKNSTNEDSIQTSQAQITFFILGSGEVSMELRRQLLDIARENINYKLNEYGITFQMDEPTIYVDAPITI